MALLAFVNSNAVIPHKSNGFGYGNEADRANDRVSEQASDMHGATFRKPLWKCLVWKFSISASSCFSQPKKKCSWYRVSYTMTSKCAHDISGAFYQNPPIDLYRTSSSPTAHFTRFECSIYMNIQHSLYACSLTHSPMFGHILFCTLDREQRSN